MVDARLRNRLLVGYAAAALGVWLVGESRLWWMRTKLDAKAVVPWDWQAVLGWYPASSAPFHHPPPRSGRRKR